MFSKIRLALFILGIILIIGILLSPPKVLSFGFLVNSTEDGVDINIGDGICATEGDVCTLRAAIQEANGNNNLSGDTITLPAGTYVLTVSGSGEDQAATGDLDITTSITITGAGSGSTIIDANSESLTDMIFDVLPGGNLTFSGLTVKNGMGGNGVGGAIQNQGTLTISSSTISDSIHTGTMCGLCNHAGAGGGIYNNGGTLTLTDVTISNNTAGAGGGLYNTGTATLDRVSIFGNTADIGAGIYNDGEANLTLTNVTISTNTADRTTGGGLYADSSTINLTNTTIYGNTAINGAGGISVTGVTSQIKNSIFASNSGGSGNCDGSLTSLGYNISSDSSCSSSFTSTGDLNNTDPLLDSTLSLNGGQTKSHALLASSPAINTGTNTDCPSVDQAGSSRPQGGGGDAPAICDIGSFEYQFALATASPAATTSAPVPTPNLGGPPICKDTVPGKVYTLAAEISGSLATITWGPPSNADKVHIRYTDNYPKWNYSLLNTENDGKETIDSLNLNKTYYFQVAGVNGCAVGPWSSPFGPVSQTFPIETNTPSPTPLPTSNITQVYPSPTLFPGFLRESPIPFISNFSTSPNPFETILPISFAGFVVIPIMFFVFQIVMSMVSILEASGLLGEIGLVALFKIFLKLIISPFVGIFSLIFTYILRQKTKSNLEVLIFNKEGGEGIEGVDVVLRADKYKAYFFKSNWEGKFRALLPTGEYRISATKPGFKMENKLLSLNLINTADLNIEMIQTEEKSFFKIMLDYMQKTIEIIYKRVYPVFVIIFMGITILDTYIDPTPQKRLFLGLIGLYLVFYEISTVSEKLIKPNYAN